MGIFFVANMVQYILVIYPEVKQVLILVSEGASILVAGMDSKHNKQVYLSRLRGCEVKVKMRLNATCDLARLELSPGWFCRSIRFWLRVKEVGVSIELDETLQSGTFHSSPSYLPTKTQPT